MYRHRITESTPVPFFLQRAESTRLVAGEATANLHATGRERFRGKPRDRENRGTGKTEGQGKPRDRAHCTENRGTEHIADEKQDTRLRVPVGGARFPVLIALLRPAQPYQLSPLSRIFSVGELLGRIGSSENQACLAVDHLL